MVLQGAQGGSRLSWAASEVTLVCLVRFAALRARRGGALTPKVWWWGLAVVVAWTGVAISAFAPQLIVLAFEALAIWLVLGPLGSPRFEAEGP